MANNIYEIPLKKIDGAESSLGDYKGKVLLLVNVASKCGLTPQYESLEKFYRANKEQGVEVLGFPANNFLAQEPGTDQEIAEFCQLNYDVSFPLFQKSSVKGDDQSELYAELTNSHPATDIDNGDAMEQKLAAIGQTRDQEKDILWNFEKFLIGRNGEIIARIAPDVTVDDPRVVKAVSAALSE